jgi:hypothetical protein
MATASFRRLPNWKRPPTGQRFDFARQQNCARKPIFGWYPFYGHLALAPTIFLAEILMLPEQRGWLASWFSPARGQAARRATFKSKSYKPRRLQRSVESLEERAMLAATPKVIDLDFGINFPGGNTNTDVITLGTPITPPPPPMGQMPQPPGLNGPVFSLPPFGDPGNPPTTPPTPDILQFQALRNILTGIPNVLPPGATAPTNALNTAIDFNGDGNRGDFADYLALKTSVINLVQQIFQPFNVTVQEVQDATIGVPNPGDIYVFVGGVRDTSKDSGTGANSNAPGVANMMGQLRTIYGDAGGPSTDGTVALVYADKLMLDLARAANNRKFPIDVAISNVVAREVALALGVGVTPINNPNTISGYPGQTLEDVSDFMFADIVNVDVNHTYLQNIGMFTRYTLMQQGSINPANTANTYDALVAALAATPADAINPNGPAYVTGTGAFDIVNLTQSQTDPTMVTVSVTAYTDNTFTQIIETPPAVAFPAYDIDPSVGILIQLGRSDDRIQIDASVGPLLNGNKITVRGGSGATEVDISGNGIDNGTFMPDDTTVNVPGLGATLTTNITTDDGTDITIEEGNINEVIYASNFNSFTYQPPTTVDSTLNTSIQTSLLNGDVLVLGGSLFNETTLLTSDSIPLQVNKVASLIVDTTSGPGADSLTIGDGGLNVEGLQNFTFKSGNSDDILTISTPSLLMPVAGGTVTYDGGDGFDTIASDINADTDFTLTNSTLTLADGSTVQFQNLLGENADLTGGVSNTTFRIQSWDGPGRLDGSSGNDSFFFGNAGDANSVFGHFSVIGGIGTDSVTVDDSANSNDVNYDITPTDVSDDPATPNPFGGVDYDETLENVTVSGTQGSNRFFVTPSQATAMHVNGNGPPAGTLPPAGDYLIVDFTGTKGRKVNTNVSPKGPGNGIWTFTDGHKAVSFTGIEQTQSSLVAAAADLGKGSKPLVKVYNDISNVVAFSFYAYEQSYTGGVRVALADVNGDDILDVITTPGVGRIGEVKVYDGATLNTLALTNSQHFVATPDLALIGGIHVNITTTNKSKTVHVTSTAGLKVGQSVAGTNILQNTVITSISTSAHTITLSAAATGSGTHSMLVTGFLPEGSTYKSGLYVAAGDVDGTGLNEIVTSRSTGSPMVRVFTFNGGTPGLYTQTLAFAPYTTKENVHSGAVIAVGDLNDDGLAEIVTAPGAGVAVTVREFSGITGTKLRQFTGFESSFKNGVSLSVGDIDGDGSDEIMLGAGAGGSSRVRVFNQLGQMLSQFKAFTSGNIQAPLRLAARQADDRVLLYVTQSNDGRTRQIRAFDPLTDQLIDSILDADPVFNGGIWLG